MVTHVSWDWHTRPTSSEGWKIHVSVEPAQLVSLKAAVERVGSLANTSYKVARSTADVRYLNSGQAGWTQVGKIATLYSSDDSSARLIAEELESELCGVHGPAIDGDLRVSDRAPVFARWGSYRSPKSDPVRGGKVTSVEGEVTKDDRRRPRHIDLQRVPPFAYVEYRKPEHPWAGRYLATSIMTATTTSLLYSGVDLVDVRPCVIKVRRRRMAYDRCGLDGVARLKREYQALCKVGAVLAGPAAYDFVDDGDWAALILELIPGRPLSALRLEPDQLAFVRQQVTDIVRKAHEMGYLLRDLRSDNLIVDACAQARLIDFEFIGPADDAYYNTVAMHVAQFCDGHQLDYESLDRMFARRSAST